MGMVSNSKAVSPAKTPSKGRQRNENLKGGLPFLAPALILFGVFVVFPMIKAFQLSFVSMSETILVAISAVSLVIVVIIMAVMANTMSMTARERLSEYATLKALGFPPGFIVKLLFGESLVIALLGGGLGMALTLPIAAAFAKSVGTLFPVFLVSDLTMALQLAASVVVGLVAAAWPAWKMSRISIVNGLRHVA